MSNPVPISEAANSTPNWLTKDYLEKILRTFKKDDSIIITDLHIAPAAAKGENYASIMIRCLVKYTSKLTGNHHSYSFIIKSINVCADEQAAKVIREFDVTKREMDIYGYIIPKLNQLLREIDDHDNLFAEVVFVDYQNCAMILEDLSQKSFVVVDRLIGLDMNETKLALRKLAKLHAASAVLNEKHAGLLIAYDCGFFNKHTESLKEFFVNTLKATCEMLSTWDHQYRVYGEKIMKLLPHLMDYGRKVFEPRPDHLSVLAHGDFWIANMMIRHDDVTKQPIDMAILDFQFCVWTSPAIDLHYFFNTSLRQDIGLDAKEKLIQYYYLNLVDNLRSLRYQGKIPTLHQFWIQFNEKGFYAFTSSCVNQAVALNQDTANADVNALMCDDERARRFKKNMVENVKVQKSLREMLPILDRRGFLDVV